MKKDILIDLDGVLNEYNGDYDKDNIPTPSAGVKEFLEELIKDYKIAIFTTRDTEIVKKWVKENNLDKYFDDITNIKKPCYLYIDDRTICHNGNFKSTLEAIKNFKVHWMR